jgi:hypothetical protein
METRNKRAAQDKEAEPEMPLLEQLEGRSPLQQEAPTERQPEAQTGMEAMMQQLLAQMSSQAQQLTSQATSQAQHAREAEARMMSQMTSQAQLAEAALRSSQEQLQSRVATTLAEHAEHLETRLLGQLSQETEKIRAVFQREVSAVRERVDVLERGQELQQQHLSSQQQKLDRLDSVVGEQLQRSKEVCEKLFALTGRLDVVQREQYQRVATVEGGRVTESLPSVGLSRQMSPVRDGGSIRIKTRPVPFDGKNSWVGYKAQFDLISDLNGWSLTERAHYLAASLAGPALTVLTNLSDVERLSYVHLTEALNTRFNDGRSAELARIKLDNRRQLANEKLAQYASEVESLTHLAYPTAGGEARDILTRERFLKGLISGELRKQIKLSRAVTFAEMLGTAIELDAVLQCEADNADRVNYRRPVVRQVREEGGSPRKRARGACFRCGSLSHQQAYCDAAPTDSEPLLPRGANLNANSRRNVQPANAVARNRRASESGNERVCVVEADSNVQTSNLSADLVGAVERLSRRVDALAADRRPRDGFGSGGRSGSVPRGATSRRGECFECGSVSHYRNRCPMLLMAPECLN